MANRLPTEDLDPARGPLGPKCRGVGRIRALLRRGSGPLTALAWTLATALLALPATPQESSPFEESPSDAPRRQEPRIFTLNQDREAALRAGRLRGHFEAGRFERGFDELERLLADHGGDVLPADFEPDAPGQRPSLQDRHLGAAAWAEARLMALSPAGHAAYEARFGAAAERALAQGLLDRDAELLAELIARWPAARAAWRAELALGDLAFERGSQAEAELHWTRASQRAERLLDPAAKPAVERRRAPVLASLVAAPTPTAGLRLQGENESLGSLPEGRLERWRAELPKGPFNGLGPRAEYFNVVPIVSEERVYATTTLELVCHDLYTGARLWSSGEPAGWDRLTRAGRSDFFRGVDFESLIAAPAAGSGIVVAALQIPFSIHDNEDIEGLTIMRRLPQRRLFAFDAVSGKRLWSHESPPGWKGDPLGRFEQEMAVAGPPIIADGMVLVPCVRMEGRVKLHVAAYDLTNGALIWQTQVVTGQRELNMFNRHEREYSAPPVRVEGDRVLVATQLGTVAALDLFNGRVLWQALYDQIPLPGTRGYLTIERRRLWRNAPPVVADGVVLVTPLDSEDLIGVDLVSGRTLLSYANDLLRPRIAGGYAVDSLLGADHERFWLGGTWLAGWLRPGGLGGDARLVPSQPQQRFEFDELNPGSAAIEGPRMLYTGKRLLVATTDGLDVFDPRDGQLRGGEGLSFVPADVGNLTVGNGVLVSATGERLIGFLDPGLVERQTRERYLAQPLDPDAALAFARSLAQRAAERGKGSSSAALGLLDEARRALLPLAGRSEIDQELARQRLQEGRVQETAGDLDRAAVLYQEAADLSVGTEGKLEPLLALESNLRQRDPERWEAVLERLSTDCGRRLLPAETLEDPRWKEFQGQTEIGVGLGAQGVRVADWALVQRALQAEREGRFQAAVLDWQKLLETEASPGGDLTERASGRIERLITALGPEVYQEIEARARIALDDLNSRPPAVGLDRGRELDRLIARYAFSRAADGARRQRLEFALEQDDTESLARSIEALLATAQDDGSGADRARLLVDLAIGLGRAGNTAFERAAVARAARELPEATLERAPYQGWRLSDLARALAEEQPLRAATDRFDQTVGLTAIFPGQHLTLGSLELDGNLVRFLWRQGRIEAFGSDKPGEARFSRALDLDGRAVDAPGRSAVGALNGGGRLVLITSDGLVALDAKSGAPVWRHPDPGQPVRPMNLALADGVVVLLEGSGRADQRLSGFDLARGARLWSRALPEEAAWVGPTLGAGRAVVFDRPFSRPGRALCFDLFTGRPGVELELPPALAPQVAQQAVVEGQTLAVPHFQDGFVALYDLDSGRQIARVEAGAGSDLFALVRHRGRLFSVALPSSFASSDRGGRIAEIDLSSGRLRDVERLGLSDVPIGLVRGTTVTLDEPWLFVIQNEPGARRTPLYAVDLSRGKRWTTTLPVGHSTLYDADWTLPAVGEACVSLIYGVKEETSLRRRFVRLEFFALDSGRKLDSRMLSDDFAQARSIRLLGFGEHLWISSSTTDGRGDRVDLLERREPPR